MADENDQSSNEKKPATGRSSIPGSVPDVPKDPSERSFTSDSVPDSDRSGESGDRSF